MSHKEVISALDEVYVHLPRIEVNILDIPVPCKLCAVGASPILGDTKSELWENIKRPTPEKQELQQKIAVTEEALKKGQACINDFTGLVEYNFTLWTHLQNPPELCAIDEYI
jgi:hypothetical protein